MRLRLLLSALLVSTTWGQDPALLWSTKIQPLFDVQCTKCHGPLEQKGGLELDTPAAVLKGNDDGAVLVPGNPEESKIYLHLAADADPHMPPKKQLSDAERASVREWIAAMTVVPTDVAPNPPSFREFPSVTQAIDTLIAEGWAHRGVIPAPPVEERTWCRRVYLDLIGRIPTRKEMEEFSAMPPDSKRETLVDRLLKSEEYPVRMRELWDVFLMGRTKRDGQEDRRKQNGWWSFLENAFRKNRPWNETVRDLLTGRPDDTENIGASWFLYERKDAHQGIAEAVAPIVYGTKIDCAQCHDHPLAREIKQAHYWGLVAAFNRGKNIEGTKSVSESAVGGFINFTNLKKESQPALVTLLTGKTLPETWPAGDGKEQDADDKYVDATAKVRVPKYSRRAAFADAATQDNPLLARAFVNRMWAALLGRGIIHPADEMNARNAPSHPELLDWLAQDFAARHYDVRGFVKGIVLSRVYALSASAAEPETFAGSLERPLMAEQIANSWRVAAGVPPNDDTLRRAVVAAMPDVLPREYNATFQQAQFFTNSPALGAILQPQPGNTVTRLAEIPDITTRVREAFLAVYGRLPDADESAQTAAYLNAGQPQIIESTRDLLWAMMSSAEFFSMP